MKITKCVATKEECDRPCIRKTIKVRKYSQSYANYSLDYLNKDTNICKAFIGYGKSEQNKELTIN